MDIRGLGRLIDSEHSQQVPCKPTVEQNSKSKSDTLHFKFEIRHLLLAHVHLDLTAPEMVCRVSKEEQRWRSGGTRWMKF